MKKVLFSLIASCLWTSLIAAPQAIVFDFGNVLGYQQREPIIDFLKMFFDLPIEELKNANQQMRIAAVQGMPDLEFWTRFAKTKGIELPPDWIEQFNSVRKNAIGADPNMFALVEELKQQQFIIALLSNTTTGRSKLIRECGYYDPFVPCLLSCEIGVSKPDPKAYEILLEQLQLPANEVVFIDDRVDNIEAAKKMGIDGILFKSEDQLRAELSQRNCFTRP